MIIDDGLRVYADLLERNGFSIYEPVSGKVSPGSYFMYSRDVNGQECFGYVQKDYATGKTYSHTMPIRPSIQHGSSMYVDGTDDQLTVEAARKVASPFNTNNVVGRHANYEDRKWIDRLYVKRGAESHAETRTPE